MSDQDEFSAAPEPSPEQLTRMWHRAVARRTFLRGVTAGGVVAAAPAVVPSILQASPAGATEPAGDRLTDGDIAILRFLAAAEILETDLWGQYAELGGVNGGNPAYQAALSNLDEDMPQYISDNTDDERSHAAFLDAYLRSKGAPAVSLSRFRTLTGSKATGAKHVKRLTNLKRLDVDTSWYIRYRSTRNPDNGATFGQAVTIQDQPAIPLNDRDTPPNTAIPSPPFPSHPGSRVERWQAIANSAGFHFAFIEQGGSSLYSTMALKCSSLQALRIVVAIGGVETNHFSLWHDKAGNAVAEPLAGVTDPETGTHFPDLNAAHSELLQTNLILPEPCEFLSPDLPACSIVRPTSDALAGAQAAVTALTQDGLFRGQVPEFFHTMTRLAQAADAAERHIA